MGHGIDDALPAWGWVETLLPRGLGELDIDGIGCVMYLFIYGPITFSLQLSVPLVSSLG